MTDIGPPRDDGDWRGYAAIAGQSFRGDDEESDRWIALARATGVVRVAREGGRVVAGASAYRVAQLFGGREVPAGAVADVCVAPERRGSGIAKALMAELIDAMRGGGALVSPLWPSTTRLYRSSGWEVAGGEWQFRLPIHELGGLHATGEAVANPGLAVRAVQRRRAADFDGPLARPDWWWRWQHGHPPPEHTFRYAWVQGETVTGYLAFRQTEVKVGPPGVGIEVTELWTTTPDAVRGLLGLLGTHSSLTKEIRFHHGVLPSTPPILHMAALDGLDGDMFGPWMLRLIDVRRALEARGWPEDARARVALEVHDPFESSPQRVLLEVEAGEARARPGGGGDVRIGVGALSAWYSGYLRAAEAGRLGLASGHPAQIRSLDRLTGDRPVWLPDHF